MPNEAKTEAAPLHPRYFTLDHAGQVVAEWIAAPPPGVTLNDVLRPEYWAHVAPRLKPLALIKVFPEDGTWEAELRVRDAGQKSAVVRVIRHTEWKLAAQDHVSATDSLFTVEWGGPVHKWRIKRQSDAAVMEYGLPSREAAYERLPELMKKAA